MNVVPFVPQRQRGKLHVPTVTLAHGGGGKAMKDLIDDVFVTAFDNPLLAPLDDQARIDFATLSRHGNRLAFTTDSFVVDPLIFPGGDIGKLAVCGTVNDLAVGGAIPLYLSCAAIIEEGMSVDLLRDIARSMAQTAREAGVEIVTGDTKIVNKGACDKMFITTTGIGTIRTGIDLGAHEVEAGDVVLVNGVLGDHGAAILGARGDMLLETPVVSDCAPLHNLIAELLAVAPDTRFIRDPTRGGIATVLNEIADASATAIEIEEAATPIRDGVRGFCEILGSIRCISRTKERSSPSYPPGGRTGRLRQCGPIHSDKTPAQLGGSPRVSLGASPCARCSAATASWTCWSGNNCRGFVEHRHARTRHRQQHRGASRGSFARTSGRARQP